MEQILRQIKKVITEDERARVTGRSIRTLQQHRKDGKAPQHFIWNGTVFYPIDYLPVEEKDLALEVARARRLNHQSRIVAGPYLPPPERDE